jgi:Family of unknown function (DUF5343)
MADKQLPYVTAYGNIPKALEKIQAASTPPRFTHDFLATKLGMSGGSARPVVPFLKRTGFLATDGTPTALYTQFRNEDQRGAAAAAALRKGYAPLYEINEYAHDLDEGGLKNLAVQVTGLEKNSTTIKLIAKSFKALDAFADHEAKPPGEDAGVANEEAAALPSGVTAPPAGLKLGYTINLNLPPTSDIAVFDAIFKSLREHLLR